MSKFQLITSFTCEICKKEFNRKDQLKVHMNQHLNIKKKCEFCGAEVHPMSLARHQKSSTCNKKSMGSKVTTGIYNILHLNSQRMSCGIELHLFHFQIESSIGLQL